MKKTFTFLRGLIPLILFLCMGWSPTQAQNLIINGTFDQNTPTPGGGFICDATPWAWQSSQGLTPLSGMQWEWRWHSSWWIDMTDCSYGNGRWVKQTVATIPGESYVIGLDILSNAWYTSGVDIFLNGNLEAHFDNIHNGADKWETFSFCWTANSNQTEVKLVAAAPIAWGTPVIGVDNVTMFHKDSIPLTLLAADTCAPAVLSYVAPVAGTSNWYLNGSLIGSNTTSIVGTQPGNYRIELITDCGDTLVKDTTLQLCCKPEVSIRDLCINRPTYFDFLFNPLCEEAGCMGDMEIDFGDGNTSVSSYPYSFSHIYTTPGTYTVSYCWTNYCTGKRECAKFRITVEDCCKPIIEVQDTCLNQLTSFTITFDKECLECLEYVDIDFGDGNTAINYGPNPFQFTHTYGAPGIYQVKYCWYNKCERKLYCEIREVEIILCDGENPCEINPDFGHTFCNPIVFNDLSTSNGTIVNWFWSFGDGNVSAGAPVTNNWYSPTPGLYTVCLTVFAIGPNGDMCERMICKDIYVTDCDVEPDGAPAPSQVKKSDVLTLSVSPNPAGNLATVKGILPEMGITRLELYSLDGKLQMTVPVTPEMNQVDLNIKFLSSGTYLIKAQGNSTNYAIKLIKK